MPLRRKSRRPLWLIVLSVLIVLGSIIGFFYGRDLYYLFSGDTLHRARESSHKIGLEIFDKQARPSQLLGQIEDTRRLLTILEAQQPADAGVAYELALLELWEILVRMPVDADNLLQLVGRGYLPLQRQISGVDKLPSMVRPSLELSKRTRRAIALDPSLAEKPEVHILLLFGDFVYSGRTDPHLLTRLQEVEKQEIPEHLRIPFEWIGLGLNALLGQPDALARLLKTIPIAAGQNDLQAAQQNQEPDSTKPEAEKKAAHLRINSAQHDLILCHANFLSKRYHQARILSRRIKANQQLSDAMRAEAARMEAEIALRQMGPVAALYKFREAYTISGFNDSFIKERIDSLQP